MTELVNAEIRRCLAELGKPRVYLATLSEEGAPRVRPLTLMFDQDRFFFGTSRASDKARQIHKDGRVEFVVSFVSGGFSGYLRVNGLTREIADKALVERITTEQGYPVAEYWKGVDDPDFLFFEVVPKRIHYMKPGAETATEVTSAFLK